MFTGSIERTKGYANCFSKNNNKPNQNDAKPHLVVQVHSGAGIPSSEIPTPPATQAQILTSCLSTSHTMGAGSKGIGQLHPHFPKLRCFFPPL